MNFKKAVERHNILDDREYIGRCSIDAESTEGCVTAVIVITISWVKEL